MNDSAKPSEVEPVADRERRDEMPHAAPPLNTFVLWGSMAISIAVQAWLANFYASWQDSFWLSLFHAISFVSLGIATGLGVAILVRDLRVGRFAWMMPGHWFLLVAGSYTAQAFVTFVCRDLIDKDDSPTSILVQAVFMGVVFLAVSWFSRQSKVWLALAWLGNLFFVFQIGAFIVTAATAQESLAWDQLTGTLITTQYLFFLVSFLALLVAIPWDIAQHAKRDTYHWLGIALGLVIPGVAGVVAAFLDIS